MNDWIAVSDKCPLWGQYVLVFCGGLNKDRYDTSDIVFLTDKYDPEITHWMPIPNFPKEKELHD